ncbi:histone-fold-containing protein [Lepidopterella palustris CBS 459.81]|uniref:DNA polymerase epsilon subunit D n=1 Tax=Lepidopterella palustris CBS 459.81 TaxID=1314670 RepID=A0A8E2ELE1_9PEZI|nr:histone-fold-containing protein [Lepidopterella palustris CBS 459.81]
MPARKSNASMASTMDEAAPVPARDGMSVEELSLPRTMVQRLAKGVLPPNTQIQKDALLAMSKGATVFVNYLTNAANENAMRAGKKTIQPKDVLDAVKELEFDAFLPRLEAELKKYNDIQCEKRNSYRKKVREAAKAKAPTNTGDASDNHPATNGHGADGDSPPAAKKARRSSTGADEHVTGEDSDGDMGDQGDGDDDTQDHEDDEVEDDEEVEEGGGEEQLTEDPIEIREHDEVENLSEGDESD